MSREQALAELRDGISIIMAKHLRPVQDHHFIDRLYVSGVASAAEAIIAEIIAPLTAERDRLLEKLAELEHERENASHKAVMVFAQGRARAEKAEALLTEAREALRVCNTGGLDLLYAIRRELGLNDKTGLSLLPGECKRLREELSRLAPKEPS